MCEFTLVNRLYAHITHLADGTICSEDEVVLLHTRGDESLVVVAKRVEEMVVANATDDGEGNLSTSTLDLIFTEVGEHAG